MNLSLLIIIVMLAVVIPSLIRRFFPEKKPQASFLEPELDAQKESKHMAISDVTDTSLLLNPSLQKPLQKELVSHQVKILSKNGKFFRGYELLQALQDVGLIHGEKDLFYYIKNNEILFTVAPTASPYVFYLDEIGSLSTEGLVFNLSQENAYQEMKAIAEKLAEELDGKLYEGH